ncbi:cytochrome P450 [Streptomyces capparidis]
MPAAELQSEAEDEADRLLAELSRTPEGLADPYPLYHRLRRLNPVHRGRHGHWVLTRYADCARLLRMPAADKDVMAFIRGQGIADWAEHRSFTRLTETIVWSSPPDHTRLRKLVDKAFKFRTVSDHEPRYTELANDLLSRVDGGGDIDLVHDFAFPYALAVVGDLLGIPRADLPVFPRLFQEVTLVLQPGVTSEDIAVADAAAQRVDAYFEELFAERRKAPKDDLISALLRAEQDGDRLSSSELINVVEQIFGGGFDTTANLLGNGMLALLQAPDQLELVRQDPGLLPRAIEEMLRFDGSIQFTQRTSRTDLDVGDVTIPAGESIMLMLGAANRDPEQFPDPDRFRVLRDDGHPLTFGGGIHYCVGAPLARLAAKVAFTELLRRHPRIEPARTTVQWNPQLLLRGLKELRLHLISS